MDDSVTIWLRELAGGDEQAAQKLWERYFEKLVRVARQKLGAARRAADEEDVALSAFNSFCQGAAQGRFPCLTDRDDLWRLLVVITQRKALRQGRHERRLKRGGGQVRGGSLGAADPSAGGIDRLAGREPTPEFAALVSEEFQRLLDSLGSSLLSDVAMQRLQGYSIEEMAVRLGVSSRSVKRKLQLIRSIWSREVEDE